MIDLGDLEIPDLAEVDRDICGSLYGFTRMAWPHVIPSPFIPAKHLEILAGYLEDLFFRRTQRGVANLPPSTGKTTLIQVMWPAWVWTMKRDHFFMFVSFDQKMLDRESNKLIDLLRSDWYVSRFGERVPRHGTLANSFFTTHEGGGRFNTTLSGKGTGWHADILVFEDPNKAKDANGGSAISMAALAEAQVQAETTFSSRAKDPPSHVQLINQQRLHDDDLSGWALAKGWSHLRLPMCFEASNPDPRDWRTREGELLWPERYPQSWVDAYRKEFPDTFDTQFQQRPTSPSGAIIKLEWITEYAVSLADILGIEGIHVQSWDFAFKDHKTSDLVAGGWWCMRIEDTLTPDGTIAIPHVYQCAEPENERASFMACLEKLRGRRVTWPSMLSLVEDKANGTAIQDVLEEEFPGWVELVEPLGSKTARAYATTPWWAGGQVHVLKGGHYDRWKRDFPRFPKVQHDDEIDQTTQALNWFRRTGGYDAGLARAATSRQKHQREVEEARLTRPNRGKVNSSDY